MGNRLTPFWLLLMVAVAAGFQQGCSAPDKSAHAQGIVVSPNDSREYRHLRLANDMDVLLISDPSSDKAAAS